MKLFFVLDRLAIPDSIQLSRGIPLIVGVNLIKWGEPNLSGVYDVVVFVGVVFLFVNKSSWFFMFLGRYTLPIFLKSLWNIGLRSLRFL